MLKGVYARDIVEYYFSSKSIDAQLRLLANTKAAEDFTEQIVCIEFASYFV
jgi:hypothetical protein